MKHNIGISGIRVKSNSLLLALFLLLVWCVQIVPGLGNAYAQYVYPAIARVLSSFSRLVPFAIGDLFIALSIAGLLLYPVYARTSASRGGSPFCLQTPSIFYGCTYGSIWHGD